MNMIFAKSFPQIQITAEMKAAALTAAENRFLGKKALGSREKWVEEGLDNLRVGNLGEIAFGNYFGYLPNFDIHFGRDQWDFLLNDWKINVKTSKAFFRGYASFLIPGSESESKCDAFVSVQITEDETKAIFMGYLLKSELSHYHLTREGLYYPAYKISFEKLMPVKDLLKPRELNGIQSKN